MKTHLIDLLTNIINLGKAPWHLSHEYVESLPYWKFEQYIKIINEQIEKEDKRNRASQEQQKADTPNFDPSKHMSNFSNLANKFKK